MSGSAKPLESKFIKAISMLCFTFGASQMILLGLIPKIAKASNLSISTIIIFYGISIFHFLLMTRVWGWLFEKMAPTSVYRVGLWGIFLSYASLLLAFLVSSPIATFGLFVISRFIHATTASSIVPFSQLVKIGHHSDANKGVLETTMFLNIGRLVGLLLGGILASNLTLSLIILMGLIIILAIQRNERSGKTLIFHESEKSKAQKQAFGFKPLFLVPLLFTLISSFYNTGITEAVSKIFIDTTKQSATIYWSLTAATLCLVLIQFLIKRFNLLNSLIVIIFGVLSLIVSFYAFTQITTTVNLIVFIVLFAIGAAIIPIYYMGHIYGKYSNEKKQVIASKISFYQTLGNAMGAVIAGSIIKLNLEVYIIFIFAILTLVSVIMIVKSRSIPVKDKLNGVSDGQL